MTKSRRTDSQSSDDVEGKELKTPLTSDPERKSYQTRGILGKENLHGDDTVASRCQTGDILPLGTDRGAFKNVHQLFLQTTPR